VLDEEYGATVTHKGARRRLGGNRKKGIFI
jgi:hypothetical protein